MAGWTAAEIHKALNEPKLSEATRSALERVGRALGKAAGTGPDDDPWLGAHRREARAETVSMILQNRGLAVSDRLPALLADRLAVHGPEALVAAALACRDEADLLARLDAPRFGRRRPNR